MVGKVEARHGLPCGHVICSRCTAAIELEQKEGKPICQSESCNRVFAPASQFPRAWCTRRNDRAAQSLAFLMQDQGNAGDNARPPSADGSTLSWTLCREHGRPLSRVETASMRPLCVDCIASRELATEPIEAVTRVADAIARRADDVAKIVETLSEVKLNGPVLEETVAEWAATETAGLIAWEERELARIRKAAEDARRLIGEVVAAKLQVGRGLLLQRMALLTTISELRAELAVPGATESEHASKQLALAADLDDIVKAFEDGTITVPSLGTVDRWLDLPRLAADLGSEGKRAEPPRRPMQLETAAEAVARAEADNRTLGHAILRLEKCRDMRIEPTHIWPLRVQFPSGPPVLPKMPPVVRMTHPQVL